MKRLSRTVLLLIILAATLVAALPAAAQGTTTSKTKTWTEDQINASYRVTNPARRSVSNLHVDLQPGQAVINATLTRRGHDPVQTQTTLAPYIEDGRIYWEVTAMLADGQPASPELVAQVNAAIVASWRNYIRRQAGTGHFFDITVTHVDVTVSYMPFRPAS